MRFDMWQTDREAAEVLACGLKVLRGGTSDQGFIGSQKPTARVWLPKATKPYANYRFANEAAREAWITQQVTNYEAAQTVKAERKTVRAGSAANAEAVTVGDIFDYSWGYDQTNVEFFEVTAKSGRAVVIRKVAQSIESEGQGSERVLPVRGSFVGEAQRKLVQWTEDGRAYLAQPYGWCDKWNGTAQHQTALGWGH